VPDKTPGRGIKALPTGVWALGMVSLFMDVSSEMIHSLLPVFVISVLGASTAALGVLEGAAEAAVRVTGLFSGALSDRIHRRKVLALAGYGIAALSKPLFPLANSYSVVLGARLLDRIGKGVRHAPRDALMADMVPDHLRGAGYGLRQSLDTIGALSGPLAATLLMLVRPGGFRLVFWVAVIPAFISVLTLALFVHEPAPGDEHLHSRVKIRWKELASFPQAFWSVIAIGAIFTLARFSEAFLVLRARNLGLGLSYVPLVMVVMNLVYAASAYPAGRLSDLMDRRTLLAWGAAVLLISDVILGAAGGLGSLMAGIALWGLHMGLSEGLLAALVADSIPAERRATAFGMFSAITGIVLFLASVIAGELWDRVGPSVTFYTGAAFAGITLLCLLAQIRTRKAPRAA
jgi:MFS family permease